jgi:DNA-binding transcriptional LysR family regulator
MSYFYVRYPDVDLTLHIHADVWPPDPYPFDVGIWPRRVEKSAFQTRNLLDEPVVAVRNPDLLARQAALDAMHRSRRSVTAACCTLRLTVKEWTRSEQ